MAVNAIPVYPSERFGGDLLYRNEIAKTANYTVTKADAGTLFTTIGAGGAVTFTLPAKSPLLAYGFLSATDNSMTITSSAGTDIVTFNNAGATNLIYSTTNQKIGSHVYVWCNQAGTKWYMANRSPGNTLTVS